MAAGPYKSVELGRYSRLGLYACRQPSKRGVCRWLYRNSPLSISIQSRRKHHCTRCSGRPIRRPAIPSLAETCTLYSLPVSRPAAIVLTQRTTISSFRQHHRTGVRGPFRVALISIAGLRVARISIARRTGVGEVSRGAWVPIARLRIARRSVSCGPVSWVAVIGARWRWRRTRDAPEYAGRPSNRRSERCSWPTTCRCSNGSAGSCSPKTTGKAALTGS